MIDISIFQEISDIGNLSLVSNSFKNFRQDLKNYMAMTITELTDIVNTYSIYPALIGLHLSSSMNPVGSAINLTKSLLFISKSVSIFTGSGLSYLSVARRTVSTASSICKNSKSSAKYILNSYCKFGNESSGRSKAGNNKSFVF